MFKSGGTIKILLWENHITMFQSIRPIFNTWGLLVLCQPAWGCPGQPWSPRVTGTTRDPCRRPWLYSWRAAPTGAWGRGWARARPGSLEQQQPASDATSLRCNPWNPCYWYDWHWSWWSVEVALDVNPSHMLPGVTFWTFDSLNHWHCHCTL